MSGLLATDVSRRSVFRGAALAAAPAAVLRRPRRRRSLAEVQPLAAKEVYNGYGVCAHPTFRSTVYGDVEGWMANLAALGVRYFRGNYDPRNPGTRAAVAAARKHKIRWLMLVVQEGGGGPTDQSVETTAAIVRDIAVNAADICHGIEGLNEPNHNRSSTLPVPADWAVTAAAHQKAIWTTAKADPRLAHKPILGPSLHNIAAMDSYTRVAPSGGRSHYLQLRTAGITAYQDWQGMHAYSGGQPPSRTLGGQENHIRTTFGAADYPIWITETGYHNALATTAGHRPTSEAAAAVYGPQALLAFAKRGMRMTRYELLDDVDRDAKDDHESRFGLYRVGSEDSRTWTPKPEAAAIAALLAELKDPGRRYRPAPVALEVTSAADDLEVTVVGKRDRSAKAYLYRSGPVWDPHGRKALTVAPAEVVVTDRIGARTVTVGPGVVAVALR